MRRQYLRQLAGPAFDLVSPVELKAHLNITHADDDAVLAGYLAAAFDHLDGAEGVTGRTLASQQWALDLDFGFYDPHPARRGPCHAAYSGGEVRLPLPPLISVESVSYVDQAGATQTLVANTDYVVFPGERSSIAPVFNTYWPCARAQRAAATIEFTAGYADPLALPAVYRQAVLLICGDWHANRETTAAGLQVSIPLAATVRNLIGAKRVWRV